VHPSIELQLESSEQFRVLGQDADIAIRYLDVHSRRRPPSGRRLFTATGIPVGRSERVAARSRHLDSSVIGQRLIHDDDGTAWREWFAAAGLDGFEQARHQYFTDYSLALVAAQAGDGIALGVPAFIETELRTGTLVKLGATNVTLGTYWLLESRVPATRAARSAFVKWLDELLGSVTLG